MKRSANRPEFQFPKDGVMLSWTAGENVDNNLKIKPLLTAPSGLKLELNGVPMTEESFCIYKCYITLDSFKNKLSVVNTETGDEICAIDVFFLRKGYKKYRFALDDNIWFLQNINENKDTFKSIFEDPYLNLLKSIHDRHNSKFHVNIYYETPRHGGFNISQMTDKFKSEFIANSDWLRFSFHANADKPSRPYLFATYEQAYFEMDRVNKEIIRFAGEECLSKTVMTLHWGDCSIETARAFRDLGVRAIICEFLNLHTDDCTDLKLYCDEEQVSLLRKYGFLYDKETDLFLFRHNSGIQRKSPDKIYEVMEAQRKFSPLYEIKDICLHEQYFYPEFKWYQDNYFEKLDTAAQWCDDNGYEPIFMDELFEFNSH